MELDRWHTPVTYRYVLFWWGPTAESGWWSWTRWWWAAVRGQEFSGRWAGCILLDWNWNIHFHAGVIRFTANFCLTRLLYLVTPHMSLSVLKPPPASSLLSHDTPAIISNTFISLHQKIRQPAPSVLRRCQGSAVRLCSEGENNDIAETHASKNYQ